MPSESQPRSAIAGATGFVGRRLARALAEQGSPPRCLVRDPVRARELLGADADLVVVGLDSPGELQEALEGCDHAYFLVHMMAGDNAGYPERERAAAAAFGAAALAAGVDRVSYLGGLGGDSPHLASRRSTAEALAAHGPPLTYFRAAMIVGPGSASYELLRSIVRRLPVVPAPPWLGNRTQPIGIRDVVAYLRAAPLTPASAGREVQIGGPDVLTHREVIDQLAAEMGAGKPRWLPITARIVSPAVMAAGAAAVTRGDPLLAAELAYGVGEETIVTDRSGADLFDVRPERLGIVFQRCLQEEETGEATARSERREAAVA
jgi:uncharacterized protein YbjT (DUF2867 family)